MNSLHKYSNSTKVRGPVRGKLNSATEVDETPYQRKEWTPRSENSRLSNFTNSHHLRNNYFYRNKRDGFNKKNSFNKEYRTDRKAEINLSYINLR